MAINTMPTQINLAAKSTDNSGDYPTTSYSTSYTNVPALVTDASADLRLVYAQRNMVVTHKIYTTQSVTVNPGDIVIWGTRQFAILAYLDISGTGRVFEIHGRELVGTELIVEIL